MGSESEAEGKHIVLYEFTVGFEATELGLAHSSDHRGQFKELSFDSFFVFRVLEEGYIRPEVFREEVEAFRRFNTTVSNVIY